MQRTAIIRPLYREIIRDALQTAWREKRLWPLALLAGFIQLGGIYDTLFLHIRSFAERTQEIADPTLPLIWLQLRQHFFLDKVLLVQGLLLTALVMLGFTLFSLVAQGALVLGVDNDGTRSKRSVRDFLKLAAHRIIPLATVNIVGIGAIWLVGFFAAIPLLQSTVNPTISNVFAYILLFTALVIATVVFTSWHMLALNSLLIDELTFHESFTHAWRLLRHSWLTVLETAALLMITAFALYFGSLFISAVISTPLVLLLIASVLLVLPKAYLFLRLLIGAVFIVMLIVAGVLTITFQYATWNRLYHRINEGTAHAKTHRFFRWVSKQLHSTSPRR